jgi:DNA-binding LytR/AlgR family response regulator
MQNQPKITCIAVDDEYFALELLESFIQKFSKLELIAASTDAVEALEKINNLKPQIVFADIQMPMLNGLNMIEKLTYKPTIIFTTAYKQFALQAFNVDAIDYLVKPFAYERFEKAVQKAIIQVSNINSIALVKDPQLLVRTNKTTIKIPTSSILFIEKATDYVYIHTDTEKLIALFTLQRLEEVLPQNQFIRIHKSYIISIKKVTKWNTEMVHINEHCLPIARARKSEITDVFLQHNLQMGALAQ